jgi:hypothetical protein
MASYMQVMKFRWNYMNEHLLYNFWLNDSITYFSDYMRTGTAFGIIAITVMLIGHMFAFYALRRPRYKSRWWQDVLDYVIKFVSNLRQVSGYSGFLHHDITEILLKVALNTTTPPPIWLIIDHFVEFLLKVFWKLENENILVN